MLVTVLCDRFVSPSAGSRVDFERTSSSACIAPSPRTSPTNSHCDLPSCGALAETLAQRIGARAQVLFVDGFEYGKRGFARNRIAGKRSTQLSRPRRIHDFGAPRDRASGNPPSERLGRDQIRLDPELLAGKHRARARQSRSALRRR